jgi:peptidoglycan glycosyltransferase
MNQAIRSTWMVAVAMFALLFGALTVVQFFQADNLNANDWNSRTLYKDFDINRGAILVGGDPIAESVPSSDGFAFQRKYTDPELYAPLTGFYSLVYGATQLESTMNDQLSGSGNELLYDRIVRLFSGAQVEGASVELTIDPELQQLAWDLLPDGVKGSIVVMEPKTGNILAMVSKPSFDPNKLAGHNSEKVLSNMASLEEVPGLSPFLNPATESLVAPGSVFKLVDTAAALESGKYDADSVLDHPNSSCPGPTSRCPTTSTAAAAPGPRRTSRSPWSSPATPRSRRSPGTWARTPLPSRPRSSASASPTTFRST